MKRNTASAIPLCRIRREKSATEASSSQTGSSRMLNQLSPNDRLPSRWTRLGRNQTRR